MPLHQDEQGFLRRVLLDHEEAVALCSDLFEISQVWDDLVDRDRPVDDETINRAFWRALVEVPSNPFYQRHFTTLQPLVQASIIDWLDANTLQAEGGEKRAAAYVLRDSVGALVIHCARIIGGYDYMREVSAEIRRAVYSEEALKTFMETAE